MAESTGENFLTQRKTILIIEQDLDIRNCLKEVLEMEGYIVNIAANKEAAGPFLDGKERPALALVAPGHWSLELVPDNSIFNSLSVLTLNKPIHLDELLDKINQSCDCPHLLETYAVL